MFGQTPAQALRDPDLPFNLTVMRGYYKARQVQRDLAASVDPMGAAMAGLGEEDADG